MLMVSHLRGREGLLFLLKTWPNTKIWFSYNCPIIHSSDKKTFGNAVLGSVVLAKAIYRGQKISAERLINLSRTAVYMAVYIAIVSQACSHRGGVHRLYIEFVLE